ncbi:hypothetical protein WS72_04010 [Burkholderia savannae]|uniref:O-antigen ligase-like membrane protein n=1 Tax=Burkholderia savannae TaxID=1637837 RepID=A0ABR5TIH3_9BURK|nr:hypothetical protein [Burkholderia savannae]KWZ44700.1 hypothetical protein WS72_04010 [Burkholderia savannae]
MRRASVPTLLFATSACFFSLNAFSVRASFAAYALLAVLALFRAPTLFARQHRLPAIAAYWMLSVSAAFIVSAFGDFYANFYVKFVLIETYIALAFWLFASGVLSMRSLERTCEALIYVHAAFFLVQLGYYLISGHFIDFDSYVRESDSEALYATKALSDSLISIRALGLYSEPSFYAMTVVPAGVVLLLAKRRMAAATIVAFATALLSFSIAAIIVCALLFGVHFLAGRSSIRIKLVIVAVALAIAPAMYGVYDKRVNQSADYDALGSRTLVLRELSARDALADAFGNGLFWDERNNVGKTHLRGYQVRDSSFYVYLLFATGGVGVTAFFGALFMLFRRRGRRRLLLYLLPLLLFKFHALYGMLWLTLLMFVVVAGHAGHAERSPERRERAGTGRLSATGASCA